MYRQLFRIYLSARQYSSALYITGSKASENFAVLTPHLDFEDRIKNRAELEANIQSRGKNIDLNKYEQYWNFFKELNETLYTLDATKHSISENLAKLMKEPDKNKDEIVKLKLHANAAKDNYKNLRDYIYPVEENAALNALSLPNYLDQRTPHVEPSVLYISGDKPIEKSKNHFNLANSANLLYYVNHTSLYLKNDAAIFEHAVINYMHNILLQHHFVPTVNASFSRSVIVEGCCTDYLNQNDIFTIFEENARFSVSKLHFVGNSSIYSFMAYFTKFSIQLGYFPLKFFTSGKQYMPVTNYEKSLFNLSQYSVVDTFLVSKDNADNAKLFDDLTNIIKGVYDFLGYHYQLVYLPANMLKDYESLHLSIQMYSCHLQRYVEVGYISLCGDYLSKRLLVSYNDSKIRKYPNIIFCRLVNIQKLLGCILEYNDLCQKELLSDQLKKYFPM